MHPQVCVIGEQREFHPLLLQKATVRDPEFDLPDLVAALAPRTVRIISLIDVREDAVPEKIAALYGQAMAARV